MRNTKRILIASKNDDKIREIIRIVPKDLGIEFLTYKDIPFDDVEEDCCTCAGNAIKKATEIAKKTGITTLADDTGLFCRGIDGAPGVVSARYAGENATDEENNRKLLDALRSKEDRTASFLCVLVLCSKDGDFVTFRGYLNGTIIEEPRGTGFAYDPLFLVPYFKKTLAELGEDKDIISHRASALDKFLAYIIPEEKETDAVNEPSHYNLPGLNIQAIDVIKSVTGDGFDDYCIGNVLKYVIRAKHKNGIEDYKKARKYLDILLGDA